MDEAHRDCIRHGWSKAPIIEMLIPSTLDDSLAPQGAHVASLFANTSHRNSPTVPHGISIAKPWPI